MEPEKTPRERAEDLIGLLVSDWRPTPQQVLWAIRTAIVLGVLIAIGYFYGITLWDWAQLLIVPAALAGGVAWLNWAQRQREREAEEARRERELEVENQRAQDAALQTYLDQMGQLLLGKDRPLRQSGEGDEVRILARARTLTVLTRIGGDRKGSVLQFLYDSGLISGDSLALDLKEANLQGAVMRGAEMHGAHMPSVNLTGANLKFALLEGADLREANLSDADLRSAILSRSDLRWAFLFRADLREVLLGGANLSDAYLRGADLSEANLSGANLGSAILRKSKVAQEQLDQAAHLKGATMPNGQKYEEWLKDSEGRKEDAENE